MARAFQRNARMSCVAFCVCALYCARAADWPQFRGDPAHTAAAHGVPSGILVPAWTVRFPAITTPDGVQPPAVTSSPAIAGGVVYVGSRNTHIYALDAETGAQIWEYAASSTVESSPLVTGGAVYFVPYNGILTALRASDGAVIWTHASGGWQDRSSPNMSDSNVVCAAAYPKTTVYAVPAASSGAATEAWSASTLQFVYSSPAVDPATGNVFCGSDDGMLYALSPAGAPVWTAPFQTMGEIFRASPTVANGKVYLSGGDYDYALHAVDAVTGLLVWDAAMVPQPAWPASYYTGIQVSSPAVDGDFVAVVGGYGNSLGASTLYAFRDAGSAPQCLWTAAIPNCVYDGYVSSPVITPASVLVGCAAAADAKHPTYPQGRLYVVDRATASVVWYAAGGSGVVGGPVLSSPAVSGDLVVIGDNSGLVTAYRVAEPGDVDGDGRTTALDCVPLLAGAAGSGHVSAALRYRGDVFPASSVPEDGARSFGDGRVTPGDVDRILRYAIGLETRLP